MPLSFSKLILAKKADNWYRDQYDDYLTHRDPIAESQALLTIMARPVPDRTKTWSGSASGHCLRQRQFAFLGSSRREISAEAANIFANGDYLHLRHQAFGLVGGFISRVEIPVAIPELNFRGTADAISILGEGLEFKSINERGFAAVTSFGVDPKHVAQVAAYDLALNLPGWRVIYENKNTNALLEFPLGDLSEARAQVSADLHTLNEHTNNHQFLPMLRDCINETGFEYRYCPYNRICKEDMTWPESRSELSDTRPPIPTT